MKATEEEDGARKELRWAEDGGKRYEEDGGGRER